MWFSALEMEFLANEELSLLFCGRRDRSMDFFPLFAVSCLPSSRGLFHA